MHTLQKPYLHLLYVVDSIILPIAMVPPSLSHLTNIHYLYPQLHQLDKIMPQYWDIKLNEGTLEFLTRFKTTTSNLKMTFTLKLGKALLGNGCDIPDE